MTEDFLQFIWKFQYFNTRELHTVSGEPVRIIRPGMQNSNQGPDFLDALIMIGELRWAGTVEIHIRSSDWRQHRHDRDPAYRSVILHVVMVHDLPDRQGPGVPAVESAHSHVSGPDPPVLQLQDRVPLSLLDRYLELLSQKGRIPCAGNTARPTALSWLAWKDRLLLERLERKAGRIRGYGLRCQWHWEEMTCWILTRAFGHTVNAEQFEWVAQSIPFAVLGRCRKELWKLESLLLGQAGLLRDPDGKDRSSWYYHQKLRERFGLPMLPNPASFLRMRPPNFPDQRLRQLAGLLASREEFFEAIREASSAEELVRLFRVKRTEPQLAEPAGPEQVEKREIGDGMARLLTINVALPLLYAYGSWADQPALVMRALDWMHRLPAESNRICQQMRSAGFEQKSAADSQAILELKGQYCDQRRCLDCAVGHAILKPRHPN